MRIRIPASDQFIGPQGPRGEPFDVDVVGPLGNRDLYTTDPAVQSYLADDTGDLYVKRPDGTWGNAIPFRGPQGLTGPQGPTGPQGAKGDAGPQGATGPQGEVGPRGDTGPQGVAGPQGDPGSSAYQVWLSQGNVGSEADFIADLTGPQGSIGPQGPQGEMGLSWNPDATGLITERSSYDAQLKGFAFFASDEGSLYVKLSDTSGDWSAPFSYSGPKGDRGDVGPTGPQGPAGVGVPTGGSTGQVLRKRTATNYDTEWAAAAQGVPAGGTTGQALRKNSATDYDTSWQTPREIPAGGGAGTVLQKNSATDYDVVWGTSALPAGVITMFGAAAAPSGWLLCDGSAVSRTTYAALFSAIGTNYGAGDGTSTFNLPDLRARIPMGVNPETTLTGRSQRTLGNVVGTESHTLTSTEMPAHNHTGTTDTTAAHTHDYSANNVTNTRADGASPRLTALASGNTGADIKTSTSSGSHSHTLTINNTGGGSGHNNIQPSIVLQFIIKT